MKALAFALGGLLVGWLGGSAVTAQMVRSQVDFEWARMLENHMVGPTQTTHPLRGARG